MRKYISVKIFGNCTHVLRERHFSCVKHHSLTLNRIEFLAHDLTKSDPQTPYRQNPFLIKLKNDFICKLPSLKLNINRRVGI